MEPVTANQRYKTQSEPHVKGLCDQPDGEGLSCGGPFCSRECYSREQKVASSSYPGYWDQKGLFSPKKEEEDLGLPLRELQSYLLVGRNAGHSLAEN